MTISDETALRIGRELAKLSAAWPLPTKSDAHYISLGRIAVKLCTPVVLEMHHKKIATDLGSESV